MQLVNQTPFQALAFRQFAPDGSLVCVVSARADFIHKQQATLELAHSQRSFQYQDHYQGDPHSTNMLSQSDLVPEKIGTDVTFLGTSFALHGQPAQDWIAEIQVAGHLCKRLLVTGPRRWEPVSKYNWRKLFSFDPKQRLTGWKLSAPEPVCQVELGWDKSFGGPMKIIKSDKVVDDVHKSNPLGPGLLDLQSGDPAVAVPAHQLDDPDCPVVDWREQHGAPQGFGPIPPWWAGRLQYAGTYDAEWLEKRHPLLPDDFNPRFWQCAHPDLIATPHLKGDERYVLTQLHHDHIASCGQLPNVALCVHCKGGDDASKGWHHLTLDGVHFDFRNNTELVTLNWRCHFALNEPERAQLLLKQTEVTKNPVICQSYK